MNIFYTLEEGKKKEMKNQLHQSVHMNSPIGGEREPRDRQLEVRFIASSSASSAPGRARKSGG